MLKVSPQVWSWRARSMNCVAVQAQFGPEFGQVLIDQPEREFIIPGRDRGMGGENIVLAHAGLTAFSKVDPAGHQLAGPFQGQEGGVGFIHVPDGGFDSPSPAGRARRPIPSSISWATRRSMSLQYRRVVSLRSLAEFSSRLLSSR